MGKLTQYFDSGTTKISSAKKVSVKVKDCYRPETYGRKIIENHVKKIAANFDPAKLGEIVVYKDLSQGGRYEINDGNHRVLAIKKLYGDDAIFTVSLMSPNLTLEQRAEEYKTRNLARESMKPYDIFRSDVIMKDPEALDIEKITEDTRVGIVGYNTATSKYPHISSMGELKTLYKAGNLRRVITIIRGAYDNKPDNFRMSAMNRPLLRALNKFLIFFEDSENFDEERLIDVLAKQPAITWIAMIEQERHIKGEGVHALTNEYNKRLQDKNRLQVN